MRKFWLSPLATLRVGYAAFQQSLSESCRTVQQNLQPETRVHRGAESQRPCKTSTLPT